MTITTKYTGLVQPGLEDIKKGYIPYLPSPELIDAVNLTIFLQKRPLLLKGDPGSGKTRLAQAIAFELGLPFEAWYIKSTSRARDGLYVFDSIRRLHDAQLARSGVEKNVDNPKEYINFGPLGRAFTNDKQTVVLIDEIDKADIDFPNDLLLELDEQKFIVEETGEVIHAKHPPIVIVTSNDEKDLPDAFLRRCIFHYISFPSPERLGEIIYAHFPSPSPALVESAINKFMELRNDMDSQKGRLGKKVSTSELLDWFAVLSQYSEDDALKKLNGKLPFAEVLLKSWEDHVRYIQNVTLG